MCLRTTDTSKQKLKAQLRDGRVVTVSTEREFNCVQEGGILDSAFSFKQLPKFRKLLEGEVKHQQRRQGHALLCCG